MKFTIENIAGGSIGTFRTLTGAAKYIARNPVFGGYRTVGVVQESDKHSIEAIVLWAESAAREYTQNRHTPRTAKDWNEVVRIAIGFADEIED